MNEARLSAIALALYFASVLRTPKLELKVLVLDDVLIGLDMSHRIPVIDLLNEEFKDHQLFVLTYDPVWYEIVKRRTDGNKWVRCKLYASVTQDIGLTLINDEGLLVQAAIHYGQKDFKAAAAYVRSAFEVMLENFCEDNKVRVKFNRDKKQLQSQDYWVAILSWQGKDGHKKYISDPLKKKIELYRWLTMNSIIHGSGADEFDREIKEAIDLVRKLEQALQGA